MKGNADAYYIKMTTTPVSKLIISLGIPTTVSMLVTSIYNMADTYFVGMLGESPQAATGILFTLQAIIQAVSFMLGNGSGAMASKELAAKNRDGASEYVSTSFFMGISIGLIIAVLGLIFLEPFMKLLGSTDTILPYAKQYGFWVLVACPFMVCSIVLNNNLRFEGSAFYAMIGLGFGGLLNIAGDYLLVYVYDMGIWGAGLSTAVSQMISFVLLVIFYYKKAQGKISIKYVSRNSKIYATILKVGFPSLIRQSVTSISNGLFNNLTKPFGDAAIAAMSIVNRIAMFIMCVGLGMGQGYQPVSSFNYACGKYDRVKKGLIFTMCFGLCLIGGMGVICFIFADPLVSLFQKSAEVREIAIIALRFATIGVLFHPFSLPINMLYQSILQTKTASFLSLLRSGLVFIPVMLIARYTLGLTGIQIAQSLSDVIVGLISIIYIVRFMKNTPDAAPELAEE